MRFEAKPVMVDAYRIVTIGEPVEPDGKTVVPLTLTEGKGILATAEMLSRIEPKVGDYVVIQEDGYTYLNPREVFERKYGAPTAGVHTFGWAIKQALNGERVRRGMWAGWIAIQLPDANSHMSEPYFYMRSTRGAIYPWTADNADLFATDWQTVP